MVWRAYGPSRRSRATAPLLVLILLLSSAGIAPGEAAVASDADAEIKDPTQGASPATTRPADAPVHFEPNRGQTHDDVLFTARTTHYTFFLTATEAVFAATARTSGTDVLRLAFVGGDPDAHTEGLEPLPGRSNHFIGKDPTRWANGVPHYAKVLLHEVWPGIDILFRGTPEGAVQYDFVLAPGADPALVRLAYTGAMPELEPDGSLRLQVGDTTLLQPAPYTFQEIGGEHREIGSGFSLLDAQEIGFWLGPYDPTKTLVIDPVVLGYSTYLGGGGDDHTHHLAVDPAGNVYLIGSTTSLDFPTKDAMQETHAGGTLDLFVTKMAPDGRTLVYSTYLGGTDTDQAKGIAVGGDGSAYLTGFTRSTDFPTHLPYQPALDGTESAFLTKLSPDGLALIYSTYLGGEGGDVGARVAVDADGKAHVAGWTTSTGFPLVNASQPAYGGNRDGFVTKLTASGDALEYSTYLGGNADERAEGIALDDEGNAYVAGVTDSADFPTQRPFQATKQWGLDAFLTKIAPNGTTQASTFFGGNSHDTGTGVAVGPDGTAYLITSTGSTNLPVKSAFQSTKKSYNDAVITRFDPSLQGLVYSTYLGGSSNDHPRDIAVGSDGSAHVIGDTYSTNFPLKDPYLSSAGDWRPFVSTLAPSGDTLTFSSYHGGRGDDRGRGIGLDSEGSAYIAGFTRSTNLPTHDAYQSTLNGYRDAFVAKLVHPEPPHAPRNLTAVGGLQQITLQWDPPASGPDITGYRIYAATTASGTFSSIGTTGTDTRTYTDTALGGSATWHYRVVALNLTTESDRSNGANATTAPAPSAPLDLTATPSLRQITIDWDPPSDDGGHPIIGYTIHIHSGLTYKGAQTTDANVTILLDADLEGSETRRYDVHAQSVAGTGPAATITATTDPGPSAPQNLSADAGGRKITLHWEPPADDRGHPVLDYVIYADGSTTIEIGTTDANVTTFTETGLTNSQTRSYLVKARSIAGTGDPASIQATTDRPPSAPVNLSAEPGVRKITLHWEAPSDDGGDPITAYVVESVSGSMIYRHSTLGPDARTFTHWSLSNGETRHYRIAARNEAGEGTQASITATTHSPPDAPEDLQPSPGPGSIRLDWAPPRDQGGAAILGYTIYAADDGDGPFTKLAVVDEATFSFTENGLGTARTRHYLVSASNGAGEGAKAGPLSATTFAPPMRPQNLHAGPGDLPGELLISWDPPVIDGGSPIDGYTLYRSTQPLSGYVAHATIAAPDTAFRDSGTLLTSYYYRVTATNAAGESPQSSIACSKPNPWVPFLGNHHCAVPSPP